MGNAGVEQDGRGAAATGRTSHVAGCVRKTRNAGDKTSVACRTFMGSFWDARSKLSCFFYI